MNLKHLTNIAFFVLTFFVVACSGKKESGAEQGTDQKEWKEMDEFHIVMAETFHPYMDSSNLEPVKTRASELYAAADKWASAPLPAKVDNENVKTKLQELKSETAALKDLTHTGTDQAVGDQLTKVHDLFHSIQEAWYDGDGAHDHHGHDH